MAAWDYAVIVFYLAGVAWWGLRLGGAGESTEDYFLGGRDLPWWAVCFSVVATETSTLTVLGVPAVAYGGSMLFLQLAAGYLLGRIVVATLLLPAYFRGRLRTAYAYLGETFGRGMQVIASLTFLLTRLLADGVRLFATAIPLKLIAASAGLELSYPVIISVIAVATIAYTLAGGIRAVVWVDVAQLALYVGGALWSIVVLLQLVPPDWWNLAANAGKLRLLDTEFSLVHWLTSPYALPTALLGGAVFSMASHGADQLIVQRLLACRSLRDAQRAVVGSGLLVGVQFAVFLLLGVLLWVFYEGVEPTALGLQRGDEVFPHFILTQLPVGVRGLLLAGIVAAAMSTLSSSLNALASSTTLDLYERMTGRELVGRKAMLVSRTATLAWGLVFIGFASLFTDQSDPVVELGLAIAGFTYGALLGSFLLGLLHKGLPQWAGIAAFLVTVVSMALIIFGVWWSPLEGWIVQVAPPDEMADALEPIAWPLYTVIGAAINIAVGSLPALWHRA